MDLPLPDTQGNLTLEQAIRQRRTVRRFSHQPLDAAQLSQLLWSAYGVTEDRGIKRAAPSAGALYPMDLYAVVGAESVEPVEAGVYHYIPLGHRWSVVAGGDRRTALARASFFQTWMAAAPVSFIITAEYRRINAKYGKRGVRYAMIEAGHMGQNLFLQAEALRLKAGIVGAFDDREIIEVMRIPVTHEPLLIMPVGHPA